MIARTWLRMNDWADNVLMCKWDPVWSPAWWGARIVVVVDLLLWQPSRWARVQPARVKRSFGHELPQPRRMEDLELPEEGE